MGSQAAACRPKAGVLAVTKQDRKRVGVEFETAANDGTRLRGTRYGGTGTDRLVLVHSLAMDRTFWNPLLARLPDDWSILAYDCRGHGVSDKPAGPYTIETFGDDLAAVLDPCPLGFSRSRGCIHGRRRGAGVRAATSRASARRGADRYNRLVRPGCAVGLGKTRAKAEGEGMASLIDFQLTRWFTEDFRKTNPQTAQACVDVLLANDIGAYGATSCSPISGPRPSIRRQSMWWG